MSTRFGENLVTDFDTITLLEGQNLIVPVGYQITSINTFAVFGTGTHRMSVGGSLSGGSAAIRINDGVNTRVTVTATGLLMGDLAGVEIYGTGSTVVNSGTISSLSGSGVLLDKTTPIAPAIVQMIKLAALVAEPDTKFTVRNFGTITGETGITTGNGLASIVNEGLIASTGEVAIQTGALDDSLFNRGRIYGTIMLGEGKGLLVNDGFVRGAVTFGAGNDTLTNAGTMASLVTFGAGFDQVTNEGLVRGSVDLGGDNDKFINSGTVTGSVLAGDGNDVIEIESGVVGTINLGSGNNRLTSSGRNIGEITNQTVGTSQTTGDNTLLFEGGRVSLVSLSIGNDTVTNEGARIGSLNVGEGNNSIVNNGRIDFNVSMGAGDDQFDNSGATSSNALNVRMGNGTNTFTPGANRENVVGGNEIDTVSFADGPGITVSLGASAENTGVAKGDSYQSFENIVGSRTGSNRLSGGNFDNTLTGGAARDELDGGNGDDLLRGEGGDDFLNGGNGADSISGGAGNDTIVGGNDANSLNGGDGNDTISGGGNDAIFGGAGSDVITIGFGDQVINGGNDGDTFAFILADFKDRITDFNRAQGDKIDLSAIDASSAVSGNQAFTFIGATAFSGVAGQLRFGTTAGITTVSADIDGDRSADLVITLSNGASLIASDFVL